MDPNLKRKDACVVCGGFLPKRKSRYCSRFCARRSRRWRTPGTQADAAFFAKVREPVWVKRDDDAQTRARALVSAGAVLALTRHEQIVAVGIPLSADEIETHLSCRRAERAERLAVVRREERIAHRDDERRAKQQRRAKQLRRAMTQTYDDEKHDAAAETAGRSTS